MSALERQASERDPAPAAERGFDFDAWSTQARDRVESVLSTWVGAGVPAGLGDAMRYAVLDGGKRLRPLLALAAAEAVDGMPGTALRAACAVELIHAYSRCTTTCRAWTTTCCAGANPTVHVQFGQAQALLAGDALQALAFELLTPASPADDLSDGLSNLAHAQGVPGQSDHADADAATQARLCRLLAQAAGGRGMAGGQAIDLASVGRQLDDASLSQMHRLKTGALLQASVLLGAACGKPAPAAWRALAEYGAAIGLAFQVVDDILDVTADTQTLGKTAGKDQANDKPTYVSMMGLAPARAYAGELLAQALAALDGSGLPRIDALRALATSVVGRSH